MKYGNTKSYHRVFKVMSTCLSNVLHIQKEVIIGKKKKKRKENDVMSQFRWRWAERRHWTKSRPWTSRQTRAGEIMRKRRLWERQCHLTRLALPDNTHQKRCFYLPHCYTQEALTPRSFHPAALSPFPSLCPCFATVEIWPVSFLWGYFGEGLAQY